MVDRLEGKVALVVGAGSIGPGWGNRETTAVVFARRRSHCGVWIDASQQHGCRCPLLAQSGR
jgi:hypothetical protein